MGFLSQEITIILIGSALFVLMAIGVIVLVLVYQKRQLRFLIEKKELQSQFQKALLQARLEAQEETLTQVGRELHDNVGQLLSSSKLLVGVARRAAREPAEELVFAEAALAKALVELRSLSKSLNKEWLEKFNFIENLTEEARRMSASSKLEMTIQHPDSLHLPVERQLVLFRIVQEAFQNALKHGKSTHVKISVEQIDQMIVVAVEDDGTGFDSADVSRHGVGIINIRNRAQLLGGEALWRSSAQGTSVTIQIPIHA